MPDSRMARAHRITFRFVVPAIFLLWIISVACLAKDGHLNWHRFALEAGGLLSLNVANLLPARTWHAITMFIVGLLLAGLSFYAC